MKGIYITEESKKELEKEIEALEDSNLWSSPRFNSHYENQAQLRALKIILEHAIVLPVEESWKLIGENTGTFYDDDGEVLHSHFKNGVIIQPKE
jgi:hypothetical protein